MGAFSVSKINHNMQVKKTSQNAPMQVQAVVAYIKGNASSVILKTKIDEIV